MDHREERAAHLGDVVLAGVGARSGQIVGQGLEECALASQPQAVTDRAIPGNAQHVRALRGVATKIRQRTPTGDGDFLAQVVALAGVVHIATNQPFKVVGMLGQDASEIGVVSHTWNTTDIAPLRQAFPWRCTDA